MPDFNNQIKFCDIVKMKQYVQHTRKYPKLWSLISTSTSQPKFTLIEIGYCRLGVGPTRVAKLCTTSKWAIIHRVLRF